MGTDTVEAAVVDSCDDGDRWMETSTALHRLSRRSRSPILATLADAFSDGGYALNLDYLDAVVAATGIDNAAPGPLSLIRRRHPRHGTRWDGAEDARLLTGFRQGRWIGELSAEHERGQVAIRRRLEKLGELEPGDAGGLSER